MIHMIRPLFILLFLFGAVLAQVGFTNKSIISSSLVKAKKIQIVDLDNDGDRDIITASNDNSASPVFVSWFENDGSENFTQHTISTVLIGARSVWSGDLDNDGDTDVLAGGTGSQSLKWYENDGTPANGGWITHALGTADSTIYSIHSVDFDGDGRSEVLATYYNINNDLGGDKVRWFKNNGAGSFTENILVSNYQSASSVWPARIDNNTSTDIITVAAGRNDGSNTGRDLSWWANDGSQVFTQNIITPVGVGPWQVNGADMDNDGDTDILLAIYSSQTISWWANDGAGNFGSENVIATGFANARNADAADIDGDGDMDFSAAADNNNTVAWFENDGSQNFTQHDISTSFSYAYYAVPNDIDGDGDLDIVATAQNANELSWWRNDIDEKQWIPAANTTTFSYYAGKVAITFSAKDIGDSTSVFYNHGAVSNRSSVAGGLDHVALNGFYTLLTAAASYTASVDFSYSGISEWSAVNNDADLRICVWDKSLSQWKIVGSGAQTIDPVNKVITVPGLSSELAKYSQFTLGSVSVDNSLPVELAAFSGTVSAGGIELSWKTESETDNRGFELWRKAADEDSFITVSSYLTNDDLRGLGTASYGQEYTYFDAGVLEGERYTYKLVDVNYAGSRFEHNSIIVDYVDNGLIKVVNNQIPQTFNLAQNYPNPFNGATRINFSIPVEQTGRAVNLSIYDQSGKKVKTLFNGPLNNGNYAFIWNGQNQSGQSVASGMYMYVLSAGNMRVAKRMTYLK